MAFLDSFLAFALTLAVLATVVTLLLETAIRFLGLKRQGQVKVIGRLLDETAKDFLPDGAARWAAAKAILENPFADNGMAAAQAQQEYSGAKAQGIYADVSLEHVLRRLTESSAAASLVAQTKDDLKAELHRIARKYDEYSSALSANFKRQAQLWSILTGIAVALVVNVDGLRILESYLVDPALRQSIIEKVQIPADNAAEATNQDSSGENSSNGAGVAAQIDQIKAQLAKVNDLALPIGPAYFPHCYLSWDKERRDDSGDPLCRDADAATLLPAFALWLVKVLVTGLLIGLGAPFWYDVARRLAAVRTALGGKGSGEVQHRGSDATDDPEAREKLIDSIAADAKATAAVAQPQP